MPFRESLSPPNNQGGPLTTYLLHSLRSSANARILDLHRFTKGVEPRRKAVEALVQISSLQTNPIEPLQPQDEEPEGSDDSGHNPPSDPSPDDQDW